LGQLSGRKSRIFQREKERKKKGSRGGGDGWGKVVVKESFENRQGRVGQPYSAKRTWGKPSRGTSSSNPGAAEEIFELRSQERGGRQGTKEI